MWIIFMKIFIVFWYWKFFVLGKIGIINVGGKVLWIYVIYEKIFFIIYVLVSESLFGLVRFGYFVGMLILIKVNIFWGLKNKEKNNWCYLF